MIYSLDKYQTKCPLPVTPSQCTSSPSTIKQNHLVKLTHNKMSVNKSAHRKNKRWGIAKTKYDGRAD